MHVLSRCSCQQTALIAWAPPTYAAAAAAAACRWEWDGHGRPLNTSAPLAVQLTSISGATLVARLFALKEGQQQLGVQFL